MHDHKFKYKQQNQEKCTFFSPNDGDVTARQLATFTFLWSLMICGFYAILALWFLRPFLYRVMSLPTWGHPMRRGLRGAECGAFEAAAHQVPCCSWLTDVLLETAERKTTRLYFLWNLHNKNRGHVDGKWKKISIWHYNKSKCGSCHCLVLTP